MTIRTVLGDVELSEGPFLGHEHLQIDLSHNKGMDTVLGDDDEQDIVDDLQRVATDYGLQAVADLSVIGGGRNHEKLRDISRQTGVNVICATGFYWDPMPDIVSDTSLEGLRDIMIREIETGSDGSDIKCGTIKIGTGKDEPDGMVEKLFLAAIGVAKATGASIVTHTSRPEQAGWHLDIMESEGLNFSHVLISHMHHFKEFRDFAEIAARGCFMGIDQIGFKKGPGDEAIADLTAQAIAHGFGKQLILSADIARKSRLVKNGGDGYATTFSKFLPLLRQRHISQAQIGQIMCGNPRALFSWER